MSQEKYPKEELYNLVEFIIESNAIEGEYSRKAFVDSLAAWEFAIERKHADIGQLIRELHFIIMRNINHDVAGRIRTSGVRVGTYVAPPASALPELLNKWIVDYWDVYTEKEITQAHIDFEKVHPFVDGNGRVGRMLMNWQRVNNGLPLLVIHTGREQQEYYNWFK